MRVVLCCGKKGCAKVEFEADRARLTCERGCSVVLSADEWNSLVDKITGGELKKIGRA